MTDANTIEGDFAIYNGDHARSCDCDSCRAFWDAYDLQEAQIKEVIA